MDKTEQKKRSEELSRLLPSVRFLRFEDVSVEYAQFRDSQSDIFNHEQEINEFIPPDLQGMSAVRSLSGKKLMNQYAGHNDPYYDSGSAPPPSPVSAPVLAPYANATPGSYEAPDSFAADNPYDAPASAALAPYPAEPAQYPEAPVSGDAATMVPYDTSDSYAASEPGVPQHPFVSPAYEQTEQYVPQATAPMEDYCVPDHDSYPAEPSFDSGDQGSNEIIGTLQNQAYQDYPDIPSDDFSVLPDQQEVLFPEPFPDMSQSWSNVTASFVTQNEFNSQEEMPSADITSADTPYSQQTEDMSSYEQESRNLESSEDAYKAAEPDSGKTETDIEPAAAEIKSSTLTTALSADAEAVSGEVDTGKTATEYGDEGAGAADYPPWEEPLVKFTSRNKKKSTKVQAVKQKQEAAKIPAAAESSEAAPGTETAVETSVLVDNASEVTGKTPVTAPAAVVPAVEDDSEEGAGAVDYPPWEEPPVKVTSRKKKKSTKAVYKEQDAAAIPAAAGSSGKETAAGSPLYVPDQAGSTAAADVPAAAEVPFAAKTVDLVTDDSESSAAVPNQVKSVLESEEELEAAAGNAEFDEDDFDEVYDDMELADIVALIDRYQKETGESAFSKVYLA